MKDFLQNTLPFWKNLSDNDREILLNGVNTQSYNIGSVFYHGSEECSGVRIVKSGRLRVFISSQNGKEMTIYRLFDRDFCMMSIACMLKNINFGVNLETETDCEIIKIPHEIYRNLLDSNNAVKNFTLDIVASKFTDVMWLFEQLVFSNIEKRLATVLLEQSTYFDAHILKITHEKIAADLGTAREVVTRQLKQFQSEGLVALSRGKIEILNEKALIDKMS